MNTMALLVLLLSVMGTSTLAGNFQTSAVADTTKPVIINLQADSNTSNQTVSITWDTDEIATTHVSFSKEDSVSAKVNGDIEYTLDHTVILTNLDPLTSYTVTVKSVDVAKNKSMESSISFETATDNKADNEDFDNDSTINSEDLDDDNDGMPDDYEISKGFNAYDAKDAGQDFDHDGYTNLEEYLAGTDPKNALDAPSEPVGNVNMVPVIMYLLN